MRNKLEWGVLVLVFAVSGSIACSRTANQNNLLGAKCSTTADCPSPDDKLFCYDGVCEQGCLVDADCASISGTRCVANACVAPTPMPGASGGGGGHDGGPSLGFDAATTLPDAGPFDGVEIRNGIAASYGAFSAGDGAVVWTETTNDINGASTKLMVALASAGATAVTLDTASSFGMYGVQAAVRHGRVYWTGPAAAGSPLKSAGVDGSAPLTHDVAGLDGRMLGLYGTHLYASGGDPGQLDDKLMWLNTSGSGTGTATTSLAMANPRAGACGGNAATVAWLASSGGSDLDIYKAAVGKNGAPTGATVSATAASNFVGFTMVGDTLVAVSNALGAMSKVYVATLDTSVGANAKLTVVATIDSPSLVASQLAFTSTDLFLVDGSKGQILRLSLSNLAEQPVVVAHANAAALAVDADRLYWLESVVGTPGAAPTSRLAYVTIPGESAGTAGATCVPTVCPAQWCGTFETGCGDAQCTGGCTDAGSGDSGSGSGSDAGGGYVCGPGSCPGCCSGNLCSSGTSDSACGSGGADCANCTASGATCGAGAPRVCIGP